MIAKIEINIIKGVLLIFRFANDVLVVDEAAGTTIKDTLDDDVLKICDGNTEALIVFVVVVEAVVNALDVITMDELEGKGSFEENVISSCVVPTISSTGIISVAAEYEHAYEGL